MLTDFFAQVWQSFLELSCPSSVEHEWHKIVKKIVTDRVKVLPRATRVDLFLELENRPKIPALITNIFMTEATTALDELVLKKVSRLISFARLTTLANFIITVIT